ncbi:MAG: ATP-binding protein, partial [Steroidobacteraceae bacterium]
MTEPDESDVLAAARVLQALRGTTLKSGSLERVYGNIIDAAIALLHADHASLQLLHRESGTLRLVAARGFAPEAEYFWRQIQTGSRSICSEAARRGARVIVTDIEQYEPLAGTEDLRYLRLCGIRAVQSTPLANHLGEPLGILSTHWRHEHRPSDAALVVVDFLARQVCDLIEHRRDEQALRDSEARHTFLLTLSDALRPLADPGNIKSCASRLLAEHLGASRAGYAQFDGDELVVEHSYHTQHLPALAGRFCVGPTLEKLLDPASGTSIAVPDVTTHPRLSRSERERLLATGIASFAVVLLVKDGRRAAAFGVHASRPRAWDRREVDLVRDVGSRIWMRVEGAAAEAALRESEARIRLAARATGFGIYSHDVRRNRSWWSPELYALSGVDPQTRISVEVARAITHPEDRDRMARAFRASLDPSGSGELIEEYRIVRTDTGAIRWAQIRSHTIFEGDGPSRAAATYTGIVLDVTERKQAEEALKRADRQKSEFLVILAHELRNPLAPIRNVAELLARTFQGEPAARAPLAVLERQTNQLSRLVDDLLDISRIEQGRVLLEQEPLEVIEILEQAAETVQPMVHEKSLHLLLEKPSRPAHVLGDRARLVQCVGNLLLNAAKYTDAGGKIHVLTRELGGAEIEIEVSDNGSGIATSLLPHVFDLFVQSERTLDRSRGGLGIGLSVVRRLVAMHGGTVSAASEGISKGSTFTIRLPRLESPPQHAPADRPANARQLRILVVDDEPDAADSLAMLLKLDGHEVETAYSALSALEAAARLVPQAVLLDIGLPRMDGYEVARRMRALPELGSTRLIALSGFGQPEDRERARAAGFDHHLVKPVDHGELDRVLREP